MDTFTNRRTILQTLAAGLALAARSEAAQIPDGIVTKAGAKLDAESFGSLRVYYEGNTEQLKVFTIGSLELKAGQSPHPPHTHPEEEILIITEGHAEISVAGKVTNVGAGDVMYAGSNRLHGIVNKSPAPMTFYYIKWLGK